MNKYKKFSKAKFGVQQCGHSAPKVKYISREQADAAVGQFKKIGVKRSYQCGVCGYWHLTSKDSSEKFTEYNKQ